MADAFKNHQGGLNSPGNEAYVITPSDAVDEAQSFRALWVGTGGNVAIVTNSGTVTTFVGAAAGSIIPMRGKRVNNTNTTASNIVGIY